MAQERICGTLEQPSTSKPRRNSMMSEVCLSNVTKAKSDPWCRKWKSLLIRDDQVRILGPFIGNSGEWSICSLWGEASKALKAFDIPGWVDLGNYTGCIDLKMATPKVVGFSLMCFQWAEVKNRASRERAHSSQNAFFFTKAAARII
jgi:hypothetical protein